MASSIASCALSIAHSAKSRASAASASAQSGSLAAALESSCRVRLSIFALTSSLLAVASAFSCAHVLRAPAAAWSLANGWRDRPAPGRRPPAMTADRMPPNTLLWPPQLRRGWPAGRRCRHARQRCWWRGSCPYPLAAEDPGGVDQGEMGECLREVADLPAAGDVVLLGVQAEVVAQGPQPLEQLPRLGLAAVERERLDQPERAGKELALTA